MNTNIPSGEMERGPANIASLFDKVWNSVEEQSGSSNMAVVRCPHQSILSFSIPLSHVGPTLQKGLDEPHAASLSYSNDCRQAWPHSIPFSTSNPLSSQSECWSKSARAPSCSGPAQRRRKSRCDILQNYLQFKQSLLFSTACSAWCEQRDPSKVAFLCFSAPSPNRATKQSTQPIAS